MAMEDPELATITLNGHEISSAPSDEWWVDRAIRRLPIQDRIRKGRNELLIRVPFGLLKNVERVYILGSCGVQ